MSAFPISTEIDELDDFYAPPAAPTVALYRETEAAGRVEKRLASRFARNSALANSWEKAVKPYQAEVREAEGNETVEDKARKSLLNFTTFTFPGYKVDHFHSHLASHITQLVMDAKEGKATKLMVFSPPQHGKSELASTRTPGFWLAHNPDEPVALVSYAASLANRNSRAARDILTTSQYINLFNDRHDPANWRQHDWHISGRKGYCLAVGVGGAITGHGFRLAIVDDPVENWAAAQSETLRESIWQWWIGTFTTRLWENASLLFIMTRWHEADLAARVLESEGRIEEGGEWKVLVYPALSLGEGDILGRAAGEPLAPSRFSREHLEGVREKVGEYVWNAEYQQNPTPPKGSMFKVGRINIVDSLPAEVASVDFTGEPGEFPIIKVVKRGTRFWDLAATEEDLDKSDPDYTASVLTCVFDDKTYILDVTNDRLGPEQVEAMMLQTARVDGIAVKVRAEQEPGQSGKSQIARFTKLLKGFDIGGIPSSGDKRVRASPLAAQVNAGNVYMLKGPWNKMFLDQIANFPYGKHDDMVDGASGGFNHETGVTRVFRRIQFKKV